MEEVGLGVEDCVRVRVRVSVSVIVKVLVIVGVSVVKPLTSESDKI